MRIISPFKDFYDVGMKFGNDPHVTYIRRTSQIDVHGSWRYSGSLYLNGKLYDVIARPNKLTYELHYFSENHNDIHRQYGSPILLYINRCWRDSVNRENVITYTEAETQNRYVTFKHGVKTTLDINPCLRYYGFHKYFNPMQLFQEIEQFIGTYLVTEPEMVSISNENKIEKAGFDLKQSFRHRKIG